MDSAGNQSLRSRCAGRRWQCLPPRELAEGKLGPVCFVSRHPQNRPSPRKPLMHGRRGKMRTRDGSSREWFLTTEHHQCHFKTASSTRGRQGRQFPAALDCCGWRSPASRLGEVLDAVFGHLEDAVGYQVGCCCGAGLGVRSHCADLCRRRRSPEQPCTMLDVLEKLGDCAAA